MRLSLWRYAIERVPGTQGSPVHPVYYRWDSEREIVISPQEKGAARDEVTLTLMGEEVPALLAAIEFFPKQASCFTQDPECEGMDTSDTDSINQQCLVCGEMTKISLLLSNIEREVVRRWPTAILSNAE